MRVSNQMDKEQYIKMTNLAFEYAQKQGDFESSYDSFIAGFEAAYKLAINPQKMADRK